MISPIGNTNTGKSTEWLEKAMEEEQKFENLLRQMDDALEASRMSKKEKEEEKKVEEAKKKRQKKIMELRGRISELQQSIGIAGFSSAAGKAMAAEVSALQTELMFLLMAF